MLDVSMTSLLDQINNNETMLDVSMQINNDKIVNEMSTQVNFDRVNDPPVEMLIDKFIDVPVNLLVSPREKPFTADKEVQVFIPDSCTQNLFGAQTIILCNREIYVDVSHAGTQIITPSHLNMVLQKKKNTADKCCGQKITQKDEEVGPDSASPDNWECSTGFHGRKSIRSNQDMLDLCGVSLDTFELLLKILIINKVETKLKISKTNRLLIFLMKMKTGETFSNIAILFSVHRTTVAKIFYSVLQSLKARCGKFVFWPDKDACQATMPEVFKEIYGNCRAILDCFEFKIEQPHEIGDRVHMYSHYKKGFTSKVAVACTSGGFVSFISKCYCGRTSDSQITVASGFLDLLEPEDVVLADKGFPAIKTIMDNEGHKAILVMPPVLTHGHFSAQEVDETYKIAKLRIHIERIIQRIKIYRILDRFPEELRAHADDIIFMTAVLVNLQPPIYADINIVNNNTTG